jgi:NADPH:quinone reductase-like Zn-dependent oxidoreductase
VSDEEAILLGDILSTAFFCVDQGGVSPSSPGDVVVVVGCGPVGLLAILAAKQRGAAQVGVGWAACMAWVQTRRVAAPPAAAVAVQRTRRPGCWLARGRQPAACGAADCVRHCCCV